MKIHKLWKGFTFFSLLLLWGCIDPVDHQSAPSTSGSAVAPSGPLEILAISPASESTQPLSFEIRIQFNASLDTSHKGSVRFGWDRAPYLDENGDPIPLEYEAFKTAFPLDTVFPFVDFQPQEISFITTNHPQDTVRIQPREPLAWSTYGRLVVEGFRSALPQGEPVVMAPFEDGDYRFSTSTISLTSNVSDWRERVIYFVLTDRFQDGDPSNNSFISTGNPDHTPGDGKTYQGGDLQGLIDGMDYLAQLGITAIWITSPVQQSWENALFTSYHGYWAQDFTKVDPHLGDMNLFREMVAQAHARGIAVIMDVVINHTGSLFNYPAGVPNVWEPDYNLGGDYQTQWLEDAYSWAQEANRRRPMPAVFQNWQWFNRKGGNATDPSTGDGTMPWGERYAGDFAGLRDVNTVNPDVRLKMATIFKWWIANTNIDGFRIDTVGHVETEFWNQFTQEIRTWAGSPQGGNKEFYMVAEVYSGDMNYLSSFTGTNLLDSVLGFNLFDVVFNWNGDVTAGNRNNLFRDDGNWANRTKTIQLENRLLDMAAHPGFNTAPSHSGGLTASEGITVLTPRQTVGYFIDNHDLYRFLQDSSNTSNAPPDPGEITNLQMALGWLLSWEGIPVIYYGTEQNYKQTLLLNDSGEHGDGAGNVNKGNRPNLWEIAHSAQGNQPMNTNHSTFALIRTLSDLRTQYPELGRGFARVVWSDQDGVGDDGGLIAYLRHYGATSGTEDDLLVVLNTHPTQFSAGSSGLSNDMKVGHIGQWGWDAGTVLEPIDFGALESTTVLNSTLYDYSPDPENPVPLSGNRVTTYLQDLEGEDYAALYFMVPPNSLTILKVQP